MDTNVYSRGRSNNCVMHVEWHDNGNELSESHTVFRYNIQSCKHLHQHLFPSYTTDSEEMVEKVYAV